MVELAKKGEWKLMSQLKSQYHMYGKDGEYNLKFVSKDGRFEALYNLKKELVVDDGGMGSVNMGTYNYSNPNNYWGHYVNDISPWENWGNVRNQIEKGKSKYNTDNYIKEYYEKYRKEINGK